jgi:hypothetical protein
MRPFVGVVALVAAGAVSACAAIAGVDGYQPGDDEKTPSIFVTDAASDAFTTPGADGWTGTEDNGTDADTDSTSPVDAAYSADARPPCNTTTCNGCCDSNGNCAGGQSQATCGTGGEQCISCGSGTTCNKSGACVNTPVDSGPPPACVASSCQKCGAVQSTCCKSDNTCGCAYPFAPCL